jgi:RimJ/RimL family protein N-acetyltransferase
VSSWLPFTLPAILVLWLAASATRSWLHARRRAFPAHLHLAGDGFLVRLIAPFDAPALALLRSDPIAREFAHPGGCTLIEARSEVRASRAAARSGEGMLLAIASSQDNSLLGSIVFRPHSPDRASLGYEISPAARGQGLATRALAVVLAWAWDQHPSLLRVEVWILPDNLASLRVAQKLGFTREGVFRSRQRFGDLWRDVAVCSLLRSDLPPPDSAKLPAA